MDKGDVTKQLIAEQIAYYRARSPEYDDWFLRRGRYDRGDVHTRQWFSEVAHLQNALQAFSPRGDVLELACGTGWWTEQLEPYATSLTAVDASPEVIELNKQRVCSQKVRYLQADLFSWQPETTFDTVFFSFWLSHVPPRLFERFWSSVRKSLKTDGRVFFIDSLYSPTSTSVDQTLRTPHNVTPRDAEITRRLGDGRNFNIVKVFYEPETLRARLQKLGWQVEVGETETFFLYASASPIVGII